MKFKIKKNLLLEALNNVSKAISSKNIIPILSGIKVEVLSNKLILTASDNDITIQTVLESSDNLIISSTGSIVIKGKYILDIIRKLDENFVNVEIVDDHKIMIYTENSKFNLNGIDVREYPDIDFDFSGNFVKMNSSVFKEIVNQTNYACSLDESRLVLMGANIKVNKKNFECSATDSYRLALREYVLDKEFIGDIDVIVPSRNLSELLKVLPASDNSFIEMYFFNNKVIFKFDNIVFQSRLISGTYPNTKNLIPSDSLFDLKINTDLFYNMVDRASVLNNDKDNNVVTLEIKNNLLKITSMSLEIGKAQEKVNIDCDNDIKISFSSKYMLDALRTIKSEEVILTFVGEIKPILIREVDNSNLMCLILPIRTY